MKACVCAIGVPMDLGQSRRGVDMGPSAVRYAGLGDRIRALGRPFRDGGNIGIELRDRLPSEGGMAFLPAVRSACEAIYRAGAETIERGDVPIFLGGDHSIALGTVGAATHEQRVGVLWIDAHGDFNTPATSPSGNIHGMPLAALCGVGESRLVDLAWPGAKVRPEDVVLVGIRDLDGEEKRLMREAGVTVFTMTDIDRSGIARVAEQALAKLAGLERLHVSFDADVLDPEVAPGVGTPVPGGLTYREAHLLMELLAESGRVTSLDLVEVNPILDRENRTANTLVGLAASLLGQQIY